MVLAFFGGSEGLIVLWMARSLTDDNTRWAVLFNGRVGDGTVIIMMATLLFIIPSGKNNGEKPMVGQVPQAAVEHHPTPRRGLRHCRRVQGERPHRHPL